MSYNQMNTKIHFFNVILCSKLNHKEKYDIYCVKYKLTFSKTNNYSVKSIFLLTLQVVDGCLQL